MRCVPPFAPRMQPSPIPEVTGISARRGENRCDPDFLPRRIGPGVVGGDEGKTRRGLQAVKALPDPPSELLIRPGSPARAARHRTMAWT